MPPRASAEQRTRQGKRRSGWAAAAGQRTCRSWGREMHTEAPRRHRVQWLEGGREVAAPALTANLPVISSAVHMEA